MALQQTAAAITLRASRIARKIEFTYHHLMFALFAAFTAAIAAYPYALQSFCERDHTLTATVAYSPTIGTLAATWDSARLFQNTRIELPLKVPRNYWNEWQISITSDGSRNPQSTSSELWVFDIETPERALKRENLTLSGARTWTEIPDNRAHHGMLYAATFPGEKTLSAQIKGSRLFIRLLKHSFSGRVTLTVNGVSQQLDLYAPHSGEIATFEFVSPKLAHAASLKSTVSFPFVLPRTYKRELSFSAQGVGEFRVTNASLDGIPLTQTKTNSFELPFDGRYAHNRAVAIVGAFTLVVFGIALLLARMRFFHRFSERAHAAGQRLHKAIPQGPLAVPVVATAALFTSNLLFLGSIPALLNTLPSFIAYGAVWALIPLKNGLRAIIFSVWMLLTLRLPLTLLPELRGPHEIFALAFCAATFLFLAHIPQGRAERLVFFTSMVVVLFLTLTHLGVMSPYTYAAIRGGWPVQYLATNSGVLVNGDFSHFVDLFAAYTNPDHAPGFSVLLRRYFHEYLWSTLAPSGPDWYFGVIMNVLFWGAALALMLRMAAELTAPLRGLWLVGIGMASSVGFITFVGQPFPYLAAYSWSAILIYIALQVGDRSRRISSFTIFFVVAAAAAMYDIAAISAACLAGIALRRRCSAFVAWSLGHGLTQLLWNKVFLAKVVGTYGNPSNAEFLSKSIESWKSALLSANFAELRSFTAIGVYNCWYATFGVGLIVALMLYFLHGWIPWRRSLSQFTVWLASLCTLLVLSTVAASAAIAPQIPNWSPGGLIPRYSYYLYPAIFIGIAALARYLPRTICVLIALIMTAVGCADLIGEYRLTMLFQYGPWFGLY